uniref:Calpain catalytic domain-containing protein n=1 Tax=Anabas testudineus TaxID=64144 RepID=A0A7N6A644_ANATE
MPAPGVCNNILSTRNIKSGYGTIAKPERFFNQDFKQLKQYCLTKRIRFYDATFPPANSSIGQQLLNSPELNSAQVEWLRPAVSLIVPNPSLVVEGISRFDFRQGAVGNCWFLASIGALTFQDEIFEQVVPLDQNFDKDYCGLFHFRFWRFGKWVDVVIDDKLPTINGRLIFVSCKDPTEFWPALLEKAYAKVCGSYSDMNAGTPAEAMMDFTGGVHMCIQLSNPSANLWELMYRAGQCRSLMGCGTHPGETGDNIRLENGLVQGHAYTVTGVKQMICQGQLVSLVRLLNPWGHKEWKGDWSDESPLWQTVSPQDREMCLHVSDNGEFWMALDDFCKYFSTLDICSMYPDFLDRSSPGQWKTSFYGGKWVAGTTAGGCLKHPKSFWTNPQYRVKIDKLLDEQGERKILVTLMQMPDKRNRCHVQNLHIGFSVFEYKAVSGKFPASFFKTPVAQTKPYLNARDVMEVLVLKPGEYLIVPSTYSPNETGSYILTFHSKEEISIQ